ncbi:MAG: creatininase family protein [Gemmatimonadetes bacterium]|nr:creatininase family protein [Gemmatimonadota bacterium]
MTRIKLSLVPVAAGLLLVPAALPANAQEPADPRDLGGGRCAANVYNCADTPNPLPEATTVWIEEMTWMDVRDALAAGKRTALVPTGGVEPNGPWLATGKHNYVLRANCDAIARELGDALCAPVLPFVPEGGIEPRSGHMTSPGTISATQATYEAVLTDIARSLRAHGFENIIYFGDSGGNQTGQRNVAERLTEEWGGSPVVAHVGAYYDYASVRRHLEEEHGFRAGEGDGLHDDPIIALNMFADDPNSVRWAERVEAGLASIDGFSLADRVRSLEHARRIVAFRATTTASAIREAVAHGGTVPPPAPAASDPGAGGGRTRTGPPPQRPDPDPRDMGGGRCAANIYNCSDTPNPLPPVSTPWIAEMTWMDVRDALAEGRTTAIIPTGGVEPNGPWLVTGKHNYVLRTNCAKIAAALGNALCAPIVKWVPEGGHDPQTGHMRSPGTISLTQDTYDALLTDIARSLKAHGFTDIVLIGDSGGNQAGQERVATALSSEWGGSARAYHIPEYYRAPDARNLLVERGMAPSPDDSDGLHDNPTITLNMMVASLASVRWHERMAVRQASIDGFSLEDLRQSLTLGNEIAQLRALRAARVIRERIEADDRQAGKTGGRR